ncbi:MAG: glutamate racemase [Alistipes indistinctus]
MPRGACWSAGVKMVVIARNHRDRSGLSTTRAPLSDAPFVGLEPAVKPAVLTSRSGVVGILATAASPQRRWRLFREISAQICGPGADDRAGGRRVRRVGRKRSRRILEAFETVSKLLGPMLEQGWTGLHWVVRIIRFSPVMRRVIGDRDVRLVNPAPAIERRVEVLLEEFSLAAAEDHEPEYSFMTSADEEYLSRLIAKSERAKTLDLD